MEKYILVVGATGNLGLPIARALATQGAIVIGLHLTPAKDIDFKAEVPGGIPITADVCNKESLSYAIQVLNCTVPQIDQVVWSVGHCPPHGFDAAVAHLLTSQEGQAKFDAEMDQNKALLPCMTGLKPNLSPTCRVVVIGSAISRFDGTEPLPEGLNFFHHVASAKAMQGFVAGLRYEAQGSGVVYHLLEPKAVDTPFHITTNPAHEPPKVTPTDEVVGAVRGLLELSTPTTLVMD